MTDPKRPTPSAGSLKHTDNAGSVFFVMRLIHEPMLPQDVHSPNEVAKLLSISKKRVYHYASRQGNPLPLRRWPNGARSSFVLRDELIE